MSGEAIDSQRPGEALLICSRKDGMGARLANLLWTWRLARRAQARTLVFWPPMDSYYGQATGSGELLDLFALATSPLRDEIQVIDGRPADYFSVTPVDLDPAEPCDPTPLLVRPALMQAKAPAPVIQTAVGPILMADEARDDALAQAQALFARLPLRRTIARHAVKAASRTHDLSSMVAVHVRRGEIIDVLKTACVELTHEDRQSGSVVDRYTEHFFRCCAPVETYARLMRPYVKKGFRILFFSDSPEMAEPFRQWLGDRLILASDIAPPQFSGLQRALFELLIMSRCPTIIGTKSIFGNLAAVIHGANFIDARRHSTPDEFVGAFRRAVGFTDLDRDVRAGVSEVLVRKLNENQFLGLWNAAD